MNTGKFKLTGGEIITPDRNLGQGTVLVEDGRIIGVEAGNVEASEFEEVDVTDHYVMPGFIDLHTHGAGGSDFMDCTKEAFNTISKEHARHGTTLLFPTTMTSTREELLRVLEVYESVKDDVEGAAFGGLHLEGPYLSLEMKGGQDPRYLRNPSPEDYIPILEASSHISRWSIAPELPGALELGRLLSERGIIASVAHTSALHDEVVRAYEAGFSMITHFYSCIKGVTKVNGYRQAGCVEAGYLIEDMALEIIGDGLHVPKELLRLAVKIKGADKVALCTDSIRGAGLPEGSHTILGSLTEGREVIIDGGVAKMLDKSCFVGSVATTDRLLRTIALEAGVPIEDSVRMITHTPATLMGVGGRKGRLQRGYDADITVCDKGLHAVRTYVMGRRVN